MKNRLRKIASPHCRRLHKALAPALDVITPQDAHGFFRHVGYIPSNETLMGFR